MSDPNASAQTVVIVGAGLAAASAATTLRDEGFTGRVVVIGDEPHPPYERPPLSKGYLAGTSTLEDALVHPAAFYGERGIELRLGAPATAIDLDAHTVTVGSRAVGYDRLLLATGSTARRLPMAEASGAAIASLRTIEDADRLASALRPGRRIAIIGGGWIGLEVAATARSAGCDVVVIEPLAEPLLRVLGPAVGRFFAELHRSHGVDVRTSTQVLGMHRGPDAAAHDLGRTAVLHLDDGTSPTADLVVVAIGAVPRTDLAASAGLAVEDGVVADEYLRTSHPDVLVAGDIACAWHPRLGRRVRVEHWDNARAQGATAARNLLGGEEAYDRLPYFFSDQYDLGMEYVGHVGADAYDELVLRGEPASGVFTAFWVRAGRVLAAMHANDWDAAASIRALVDAGEIDLAALRDPRTPLDRVLEGSP